MSASEVSLMDMPDIAMMKIFEKCDYKSIQILRKVCHDLRNFIDDSKPDSKFRKISVISSSNSISMDLNSSENPEDDELYENSLILNYESHENGCLVFWDEQKEEEEEKEKILENLNFLDVFWNDFRIIMEHQKTILKDFWFLIDLDEDSDISKEKQAARIMSSKLEKLLDSRKIRSENFQMDILEKGPLLSILPLMDSGILSKIEISNVEDDVYTVLTSEDVGHLEQWKNSKILRTHKIQFEIPISEMLHFVKIDTDMRNLTFADIGILKNEFLRLLDPSSVSSKFFSIRHNLQNSDVLQFLGPRNPELFPHRWEFHVPGAEKVLWIQIRSFLRQIELSIKNPGDSDYEDHQDWDSYYVEDSDSDDVEDSDSDDVEDSENIDLENVDFANLVVAVLEEDSD